jgi:hypothetical protein
VARGDASVVERRDFEREENAKCLQSKGMQSRKKSVLIGLKKLIRGSCVAVQGILTAARRFRPKTAELMLGCPDEGVWAYVSCGLGSGLRLGPALDRALKRAVQCGFCLFIFLLADLALLVLDLQLKQFFLQGF